MFEITLCDMFIHADLVKFGSLTCCDRKQIGFQVYLIDELAMRYDVNLFQFILNLMEGMCLVQESWKFPVGWLKLTTRINKNSKGIETGSNMLVNHLRNKVIVGHWYLLVSIDFHEHAMTNMMVLRQVYALVFLFSNSRKPFQGWTPWDGGASGTWKVSDCMEG